MVLHNVSGVSTNVSVCRNTNYMICSNEKDHIQSKQSPLGNTIKTKCLLGGCPCNPRLFLISINLRSSHKSNTKIVEVTECFSKEVFLWNKVNIQLGQEVIPFCMLMTPRIIISRFCFCSKLSAVCIVFFLTFSGIVNCSILCTTYFCNDIVSLIQKPCFMLVLPLDHCFYCLFQHIIRFFSRNKCR